MLWERDQIKRTLIARMLALRAAQPALFADGDYLPLQVTGPQAKHAIAFVRRHGGRTLLIAALRLPARGPLPDGDGRAWDGTELLLPAALPAWRDVLSPDATLALDGERIALGSVPGRRPVAALLAGGAQGSASQTDQAMSGNATSGPDPGLSITR